MADTNQTGNEMADIDLKSQEAQILYRVAQASRGRGLIAELDCRFDDAREHFRRADALFRAAEAVK